MLSAENQGQIKKHVFRITCYNLGRGSPKDYFCQIKIEVSPVVSDKKILKVFFINIYGN